MAKEYQIAFAIGAKLQGQFGAAFKGAQKEISNLQGEISSLNKTQGDISSYQRQQSAIEKTQRSLALYREQLKNLKNTTAENSVQEAQLQNAIAAKDKQVLDSTKKLEEQQAKLNTLGNALSEAGVDMNDLSGASAELSQKVSDLSQQQMQLAESTENADNSLSKAAQSANELMVSLGVTEMVKELYSALKECAQAAIDFEQGMAAVKRTVGGSDVFLGNLADSFKEMSTVMPITTEELTAIATTAGQLGIAQNKVEEFTQVMAQLATTTDLSADQAATMLAQFANITGISDFGRMGSVVAELGDATATTASKVVEMSQGMAAAASIAGMSATDIMAISAAVGSLGIEAQAGSTSMSQLISTLYMAVETGENLNEFASVANMSAKEFKQAWGQDAAGALNAFIQGLNDTERNGRSAIVILNELGINNVRQTKAILGLAQAGDMLSKTISQASSAWEANTALQAKAAVMYETTQSQLTMMNNALNNLKIAFGEALTPVISEAAGTLTNFIKPITAFVEQNPALVKALAAAGAALAAVVGVVAVLTAGVKLLTIASTALHASMLPIIAVAAGIAALTGVITYFTSSSREASEVVQETTKSFEEMQEEFASAMSGYKQTQNISDLISRYGSLNSEISDTKRYLASLVDTDTSIELTATAAETLSAEDFIIDQDTIVDDMTATAQESITPDEFVSDEDVLITGAIDPNAELLSQNGFVEDEAAMITGKQDMAADLISQQDFIADDTALITGERNSDSNIDAQDYIAGIALIGADKDPDAEISAQDYIDGIAEITGTKANKISAQEYITGNASITGEHGNTIGADEFIAEGDLATINGQPNAALTYEQFIAENSEAATVLGSPDSHDYSEFINTNSDAAQIHGTAVQDIDYVDFMQDDLIAVQISGEAQKTLNNADFMAEEREAVEISAEPGTLLSADQLISGDEVTITAAELTDDEKLAASALIKGDTVTLTAELNTDTVNAKITELQGKAVAAKDDLLAAKSALDSMNTRYGELSARLKHTSDENTKSGIRTEMENLLTVIGEQETKVGELEQAYIRANAEYSNAASAANTLAEQEAALAGIKAELAAMGYSVAGATAAETEAMLEQIRVANELERTAYSGQMKDSLFGRAAQYSRLRGSQRAWSSEAQTRQGYYDSIDSQRSYADYLSEARAEYQRIYDQYTKGGIFANVDTTNFNSLMELLTGNDASLSTEAMILSGSLRDLGYLSDKNGELYFRGQDAEGSWSNLWARLEERRSDSAYSMMGGRGAYAASIQEAKGYAAKSASEADAYLDEWVDYATTLGMTTEETMDMMSEAFANMAEEDAQYAYEYVTNGIALAQTAQQAAAEATSQLTADEAVGKIQPIIDQMNALGEAYDAAYTAAYNSMDGQFKLFEQVEAIAPKANEAKEAVEGYVDALMSQAAYMAQYTENLQAVRSMGLSDALVAELSDGSVESATILANIVEGGAAYIDDLNTAFASVEEGKSAFASTVAEMETNFSTNMANLEAELQSTVENMDMSAEAAAAAEATVQAFADAAEGKVSAVSTAFARIAAAAAAALALNGDIQHNASGTDNARRGLSWVGENGPELVWLNGGERIMDAQESAAFASAHSVDAMSFGSGANFVITVSPEYNIGGGDADSIGAVLASNTDSLRDLIEDTIYSITEDRERSLYSR